MGIEIERRFLVKNEEWRTKVILSKEFRQAYLNSSSDEWTVRIRIINNTQAYITLKSFINGSTSYEFEYQIPIQDAIELFNLSKNKINKTRYQIKIDQKDWVVDSFKGLNSSLTIAEIELNSESEQIQIPSWCEQEITGVKSFSNASLARKPISELSIIDRIKTKDT